MDDWREKAKGSLSVRNWLPTIKRFSGDRELAKLYLPLAQTILGKVISQTMLGGIEAGARIVKLNDGTIIKVVRNSDVYIVDINAKSVTFEGKLRCLFYVESGLVHVNIAGVETIDLQEPGVIYRDLITDTIPDVGMMNFRESGAFKILDMPNSGGTSIAFGIAELLENPINEAIKLQQQHVIFQKALTSGIVPSSLFSGLLQLFVQTKYGMDPKYWDVGIVYGPFQIPYITIPDKGGNSRSLTFNFGNSCGIVASSTDYIYYLVNIQQNIIYYSKITFKPCGLNLLRYVKRLGGRNDIPVEDLRKFESYLFSSAVISAEIRAINISEILGSPIGGYNGWSFNLEGTKANIITHEQLLDDDNKYYFVSRSHELTFEATTVNLTATLAITEETSFQFRKGDDFVWYYDYLLSYMLPFSSPINKPWASPQGDGVALYCYYDKDSNLITVRWNYSIDSSVPKPPGTYDEGTQNLIMCGAEANPNVYLPDQYYVDSTTYLADVQWGDITTSGFYCEKLAMTDSTSTDGHYRSLKLTATKLSELSDIDTSDFDYGGYSNYPTYGAGCDHSGNDFKPRPIRLGTWAYCSARYQNRLERRSIRGGYVDGCLILPQNDVSCSYLLKLKYQQSWTATLVYRWRSQAYWEYFFERDGTVTGFADYYDTNNSPVDYSEVVPTTLNRYILSCNMVDRADVTDIITEEYSDVADLPTPWTLFFSNLNPFEVPRDRIQVIHNLKDSCMYTNDITDPTFETTYIAKGEYPYAPGVAFVGWS